LQVRIAGNKRTVSQHNNNWRKMKRKTLGDSSQEWEQNEREM